MIRISVVIVFISFLISAQAYQDDYVWQEIFEKQFPRAEAGHAAAQYRVGSMFEKGNGVKKSLENAYKWFSKAAQQGHNKAAFKLGFCYLEGKGVKKNFDKALKWLTTSANKGNVRAFYYIGRIYEKGLGTGKDLKMSLNWYQKAKDGGYSKAASNISKIKKTLAVTIKPAPAKSIKPKIQQSLDRPINRTPRLKNEPNIDRHPEPVSRIEQPPAIITIKDIILKAKWSKQNKPALFLPSTITQCIDEGKTIECTTNDMVRNLGMANIRYSTKTTLYGLKESGSFNVSYRNNIRGIKVTDEDMLAAGETLPLDLGLQSTEHKMSCLLDNINELTCSKNKFRQLTLMREAVY